MIKSFFSSIYIFFAILSIIIILSGSIPPDNHWLLAFLPLFIPAVLLINSILLIVWIIKNKYIFLILALAVLVMGWKYFPRTFQIPLSKEKEGRIKVLSYNVRVFNTYTHLSQGGKATKRIIKFASNYEADIKCFQEFYLKKNIENRDKDELTNTVEKVSLSLPFHYFQPSTIIKGQYFGLAIFTKYPIIKKGEIKFSRSTFNQAIYVDIVIGADTLRVYNIHLQSMSINEDKLPLKDGEGNAQKLRELARKIKWGASYRSDQVKTIVSHIESCPYKMIVCGDLNDTPYSYPYNAFRSILNSAFELKGKGFGFTYNGKLFFLRIDNVFSDKRLKIKTFKTLNNIKYSDHFPLETTFSF